MAFYPKISVYYLAIIVNGLGGGLLRPAISSSLSLHNHLSTKGRLLVIWDLFIL
jgi:hypothetical protein